MAYLFRTPVVAFMLVLLLLPLAVWPVEILTGPSLTMDPNGLTPLAGEVALTTDVPSRVILQISDGRETRVIEFPEFGTDHVVPVLGFKPRNSYEVGVTVIDQLNERLTAAPPLSVVTGSLPTDFPVLTVHLSNPALMEPGYTLFDRYKRTDETTDETYSMIVDAVGDVVWYATLGGNSMEQLEDGTIMYLEGQNVVVFDMLGAELLNLPLSDPGEGLHHDLVRTEIGSYLSVTRRGVVVSGYPSSETDPFAPPQTATVADDPVLEFAADGSLVGEWSLMALLDPTRIGYDSLNELPVGLGLDWAHANALSVDPLDDGVVVSLRHQDAMVKFDRLDGSLQWILAPPHNWPAELLPYLLGPVGTPFEWSYHQHAPDMTSDGTVLVFDNGNHRASPFDGQTPMTPDESYSRGVEYLVDEVSMQVSQVWEYRPEGDGRLYSPSRGDADRLIETGNSLMTFSAVSHVGGATTQSLALGRRHVRVIEADHNAQPNEVFDLQLHMSDGVAGIIVYRADRIASVYPSTVITYRAEIFSDRFESGDASRWNHVEP